MITQYNTDGYAVAGSDIQNIVANRVKLADEYILMETGDNVFTALIRDCATGKVEQLTFTRGSSGYNTQWKVQSVTVDSFDYTVSNEYYVCSNLGIGRSIDLPVYEGAIAYSVVFAAVFLASAIMFKGVLFRCLRRKR